MPHCADAWRPVWRRAWTRGASSREANGRGSAALKSRLRDVSDVLQSGDSVSDGLARTGRFFPPLFRELADVGEQTGNQAEVFRRLADHYDYQVQLRRSFISSITWPCLQLAGAIFVVGLLILALGMIPKRPGIDRVDVLGLGLMGVSGLVIYLTFIGGLFLIGLFFYQAIRRGVMWTRPLQRGMMRLPVLGPFLQVLALSRLSWTISLTTNTSLDLRKVLELSLRSTHNARYTDHLDTIVADAVGGHEIYEAFASTGVFRDDFLDVLEVAERSGTLPESMAHLAGQYQDQARRMMTTLALVGGFAIWGLIAIAIIAVIFRIASFYIGTINDLLP